MRVNAVGQTHVKLNVIGAVSSERLPRGLYTGRRVMVEDGVNAGSLQLLQATLLSRSRVKDRSLQVLG